MVRQVRESFQRCFADADLLTTDSVELLQGLEEQYESLKKALGNVRSFGELCGVRTPTTHTDCYASVLRLLDILQKPCVPTRIAEMLRRGHIAARHLDEGASQVVTHGSAHVTVFYSVTPRVTAYVVCCCYVPYYVHSLPAHSYFYGRPSWLAACMRGFRGDRPDGLVDCTGRGICA